MAVSSSELLFRARQGCAAAVLCLAVAPLAARADDVAAAPQRPAILFNRWQEDWSVLADPRGAPQPFDEFKYIRLSSVDPNTYLSCGADTRERFEANNAQGFGTGANKNQDYVISRNELHADLHIASQVQVFVQVQSDFAPWKTLIARVDTDRLDLEQAFIALTEPVADGTLKLRLGRPQFAFDLQRFVSVPDGPHVRQSYDAGWGDYENGPWRFITFYSHPVQVQDNQVFDDYSNGKQTFGGARLERKLTDTINLTGYYANFTQADVHFSNAAGKEDQDILDLCMNGTVNHFDWDLEAMNQTARIGSDLIEAWAFGSPAGYTFNTVNWSPRLGIQLDAASGDGGVARHHFGTFNPLFPNGYYLTLAGYTGYVNFIHIKPSLTLHSFQSVKVTLAGARHWGG